MTKDYEKNDKTLNNIKDAIENSKSKTDSEDLKKDINRLREDLKEFKKVTRKKVLKMFQIKLMM